SGDIVTSDGTVVGHHDGIEQFTIGQRKGLRVAFGQPRYVIRIDPESHHVVIGTHEELARTELTAAGANWLTGIGETKAKREGGKAESTFRCFVKIRYRSPAVEATVERLPDGRFRVRFHQPCYGVAPGQAAVCYDGDRVLGGGWIQ
ncbi:MAG: tRNA 2-thiouridine(34) synthase MnmA, partial [Planctomycetaceae bacterium]|nr:tRNA 2-thiouridine(34) synthase MnmA [Planctomycetaceae bacterium]